MGRYQLVLQDATAHMDLGRGESLYLEAHEEADGGHSVRG